MYKFIKWSIYIWTAFCLFGFISGLVGVSEMPQPTSDAERAGATIGTAIGLGFWALLWFVPTVGLAVIGLLVRPRAQQLEGTPAPPILCPECGKYFAGKQNFCPYCGKPSKAN